MTLYNVPNCFSGDCDCAGSPPPGGFCPYGDCMDCVPSQCPGPKCCCCSSVDVVLGIRSRCYDRIYFSCNIDGSSAGPGEDTFPIGCTQCYDACDRALSGTDSCTSISQPVSGQPSPPDWWTFPPSIGPCSCNCVSYVDENDPSLGCNLTCVTCAGIKCNADVEVIAGSCNYQFNLTPGSGCCGTPAIVDVVFAIDYSGSMGSVIDSVISNVVSFADAVSLTGGQARFGLFAFGKGSGINDDPPPAAFSNGTLLTTNVDEFETTLQSNLPVAGGQEACFDAVELCLTTYPWAGVENLLFLISDEPVINGGPISGGLGDPTGQPDESLLISLANRLGVTVHVIQPVPGDRRKTALALGTNGQDIDIAIDFSTLVDELNLNVFGASCDCLDTTPIPVLLCKGGVDTNGECVDPDPNVPIRKCVKEDNSDCLCGEPLVFEICGEVVIVEPFMDTIKLVCCGNIEGGGCSCPTEDIAPEGCCGTTCSNINICLDYANVQDAIDATWCECWQKAMDGEFTLETPGCTRCTVPDSSDPDYANLDINAIVNCVIKIPDGRGGLFTKTRAEVAAEVEIAWANCQKEEEPPVPPSLSEASCLPNCNRPDECITGSFNCPDSQDIRICRATTECTNKSSGCTSVRNPATTILNNGIGLVAFESLDSVSVIQIHQFNTSVPAKILPNRRTNYGRLQNSTDWEVTSNGSLLVKLYYFEDISTHFLNGVTGLPPVGSLTDLIVFRNGPLQNQCFSLDAIPIGNDEIGDYIKFTVPSNYSLSNNFPSPDDVYNIEWFIVDSNDTGLTGSAKANTETPGSDFLLENPSKVNALLRLSPHVHDGSQVPVANPSLATANNYMNALENSHYVYLAYQAFEDEKWNVYLRQLRLSEYSKEEQLDEAEYLSLSELGLTELIYRIVCSKDSCSSFGDKYIAKRTIAMEVVLPDGREVFNQSFITNDDNSSWNICPGSESGNYPKKKVFSELTHSIVVDQCPDQFQFDEIFYNWETGDEFPVPFVSLDASQLHLLLRKANDSSAALGDNETLIDGITITSSQVIAIWFDDQIISNWVALDSESFSTLSRFKGIDASDPILISSETGHCTHPVISVNSNNDVFIVYECTDPEKHQIQISGTSVPSTSFPTGIFVPKNMDANLDYFLSPKDFVYRSSITSIGMNQLPDLYIDLNDVVHVAWQSNRDNYWEIYYANSEESFYEQRITSFNSKSLKPSISGDSRGNLYIVWHDNRFGNWEVLMAYRDGFRDLTLLEQDPYLAGVRNSDYSHFDDIADLVLTNESYTEPLCLSNFVVRFYEDRLLTHGAFDVAQSSFPQAFNIPGTQDDRFSTIWENADIAWDLTSGVSYDKYGPTQRSKDSGLAGSDFDTIQIVFSTQPRFIRFLSSSYEDEYAELAALKEEAIANNEDPDLITISNTQWYQDLANENLWISADHITSGSIYNVAELVRDYYSTSQVLLGKGRYKRVELLINLGDPFSFTSVTVVSVVKSRVCLSPRETITGHIDLTPSIRVDSLGVETVESPIPNTAKKNQVYFISLIAVKDTGQLVVFGDQKASISCSTCDIKNSSWNSESCSLKITFSNISNETQYYNARVRFYADFEKQDLIAQFDAFSDGDLRYFTMDDNASSQDVWQTGGLEVFSNNNRSIMLWPFLSENSGLICGVTYWVEVEQCYGTQTTACLRTDLSSDDIKEWACSCSSTRWSSQFGESPTNIRNLIRWKSSAYGFSDTRITETSPNVNNINPRIRIRTDLTGLVLYESNRDDAERIGANNDKYALFASAFSNFPSSDMYATGAEAILSGNFNDLLIQSDIAISSCSGSNCNDGGVAIEGRNVSFSIDQYDNIFLAAERQQDQKLCQEFREDKQQSIIVHRCGLLAKNLIFVREDITSVTPEGRASAVVSKTAPISPDSTFKKTIKLARVTDEYANYHVTRSKRPVAVVSQCEIVIEVITEPETIAIRIKNETGSWSTWYPFNPDLGENTLKIPWKLSALSGIKNVTIESATYQGLSTNAVLEIIADYKGVEYLTRFYKLTTPDAPVPITGQSNEDLLQVLNDNQEAFADENALPSLEGIPVAGIRNPSVNDESQLVRQTGEYIFVEISPSSEYLEKLGILSASEIETSLLLPTFDVLQQGEEDLFSLPTIFVRGQSVFRGVFPVKKDNQVLYRDGLSFIILHFKNDCTDSSTPKLSGLNIIKDNFNIPVSGNSSTTIVPENFERDELGRIKYPIAIRGSDDPYFVFGDPNYRASNE